MTLSTQTIDQFIASEKALAASQIVAQVHGRGVTRDQLSAAFDLVADKANWKNPINVSVVIANDFDMALIGEAVTFYAGCVATFTAKGRNVYVVHAKGYYAAVGA